MFTRFFCMNDREEGRRIPEVCRCSSFGMMCVAGFATSGFSGGSACAIFLFLAELLTFGKH